LPERPSRRPALLARLGIWPVVFTLTGLAIFVLVIAYMGWGATLRALDKVSAAGFAIYLAVHLATIGGLAAAWWLLLAPQRQGRYPLLYWGRMVRDAAGEFLPFSHIGGFVLGARVITLYGVNAADAAASTLADIAAEFLAELGFIGTGALLLALRAPRSKLLLPVLIGLGAAAFGALGFIAVQRGGSRIFSALAMRIAGGDASLRIDRLRESLDHVYERRRRLAGALLTHLICWFSTGLAAYIAFHALGAKISLLTALAIEAILHAILSAGFFVPGRIGVQEAAYTLLGTAFGIPPDIALSVSLLRRARNLIIGVPVLLAWQGLEARRLRYAANISR
jgi:putative membrane protein